MKDFSIVSINISAKKGVRKNPVDKALLRKNLGICEDAHAGDPVRQISLLAIEDINYMKKMVKNLKPGDFAENITTKGIDLPSLPVGTLLALGDTELEVTKIGKKCHHGCSIKQQAGECIMPKRGIFVKVIKGGTITARSRGKILSPPD